jgi:hypothetical protein
MPVEAPKFGPEADEDNAPDKNPERVATGPLSDTPDTDETPRTFDARKFLEEIERLAESRNLDEAVEVDAEKANIGKKLEQVSTLVEKEKEKNGRLSGVRQDLGVPHEDDGTLQKLQEAKEALEEEQRHIELAGEYNDTLESFGNLSGEELRHIAETGMTSKGEKIRDKYGKEIHSDVARELASMYRGGKVHMTWGSLASLKKLEEVATRILHDVGAAVKGVFRGPRGGAGRPSAE